MAVLMEGPDLHRAGVYLTAYYTRDLLETKEELM